MFPLEQNTLKFFPCVAKKAVAKILYSLKFLPRERYLPIKQIYRLRKRELFRPRFPNPNERIFFELEKDRGIGNRLKVIVSNLHFYRGQKLACVWPVEGWVTADLHDLFEVENFTIETFPSKPEAFPWKISKNRAISDEIGLGADIWASADELVENWETFGTFEKTAEPVKRVYRKIFANFKPSEAVAKRIAELDCPPDFASVQIRRNKDWAAYGWLDPVELYFEQMDTFPRETRFFLSTLNAETSAAVRERYGDRVFELPNKNHSSMVDAAADLFLLSRGNVGLYPFGSTFSEIAWWLGGATQKVVVVGNEETSHTPPPHKRFVF